MTVIELGELSSEAPTPADRPVRARDVRWIAVAVLTVAVLLGVGGSARPEERGLRILWRMPITEQFTLDGDRLYVHRAGLTPGVVAYSAVDGERLWTFPLETPPGWLNTSVPGLVLVPSVAQQADGSNTVQDTLALDADTGALRWRLRGEATVSGPDGILQLEWDPRGQLIRMHLVRPSDGEVLWTHVLPGLTTTWTVAGDDPARPDLVVTGTSGGRIEVRRMADGSLVRAATVPWPSPASLGEDSYAYLHTTADLLFSVRTEGTRQTLTAFDIRTLNRVWGRTEPATAGVFDCGRLVCVGGGGGPEGVRALDPRTGQERWRSQGWDYARTLHGTRLFAENHRATNSGVIDATTGKMITLFPPGMAVFDYATGDLVLLTITRDPPTRLAVQQLLDDRLVLRGAVSQMSDQGCQLSQGRLACAIFESGVPGITVAVMAVG